MISPPQYNSPTFHLFHKMKNSNRLIFCQPIEADFARFYEINADPETNLFNPNGAMNFETAEKAFGEMCTHWQKFGFGTWSIREKEKPEFIIGFGGLSDRFYGDEIKLNLGYRFDKRYWGRGYATELAQTAIDFGFNELNKIEIFAIVRPRHLASIHVLEKSRMQLFGELNDVPNEVNSLVFHISNNPKDIVKIGYDRLSSQYRHHFDSTHSHDYFIWINDLLSRIDTNSKILELGCGDGIPVAQILSANHKYTGIDLSPIQIQNAKENVPNGTFLTGDMTELNYSDHSFDCIIALYSIIHVPIDEQKNLLSAIYRWLQPNGFFLCTLGAKEWVGTENNWILPNTTMYWSHTNAEKYSEWLTSLGFIICKKEYIAESTGAHVLFLLKRSI